MHRIKHTNGNIATDSSINKQAII